MIPTRKEDRGMNEIYEIPTMEVIDWKDDYVSVTMVSGGESVNPGGSTEW